MSTGDADEIGYVLLFLHTAKTNSIHSHTCFDFLKFGFRGYGPVAAFEIHELATNRDTLVGILRWGDRLWRCSCGNVLMAVYTSPNCGNISV